MKRQDGRRKCLHQLATLLKRMDVSTRRQCITAMPEHSRAALLEFMTVAQVTGRSFVQASPPNRGTLVEAPKRRFREKSGSAKAPRVATSKGGIRTVRPGAFQASICFSRLLVRSCTTRSPAQASQFHAVLSRMCQLVGSSINEECICAAQRAAMAELGMTADELRFSYATVVSSGSVAGMIESPTASLTEALSWRQRLSVARAGGWSELRRVWLEVLRERHQRSKRRILTSANLRVQRVDSAFQKYAERRCRISMRKEAQRRRRDDRHRMAMERRSMTYNYRLQVMVKRLVSKLEGFPRVQRKNTGQREMVMQ